MKIVTGIFFRTSMWNTMPCFDIRPRQVVSVFCGFSCKYIGPSGLLSMAVMFLL